MEKKRLITILLLIVAFSLMNAQTSSVKIASDLKLLCDCGISQIGDTMKYEYKIVNVGDEDLEITYPFWNGSGWSWFPKFDHKIEVKNTTFPATPISYSFFNDVEATVSVTLYDEDEVMTNFVAPGDTAVVYVEDVIVPSRHKEGNNTIVVWPENLNGITIPDSLEYQISITSNALLPGSNGNGKIDVSSTKIFPNPANGFIYVLGLNEIENEVSAVSVHNMDGQMVKQFNGIYEQYDVSNLPPGHYTLNFHLKNNGNFAKPLIIQK